MTKIRLALGGCLIFFGYTIGLAQEIPALVPNTYVQDHANVMTPEDEAVVQNQLAQLKIKYNLEYGVVTIPTIGTYDIAPYSLKVARTYGIGVKDGEKRGLLLLLAIKERKWRFEISRNMEAVLTDSQAGTIGRNVLVPRLKTASSSNSSKDWKDAILITIAATEQQFIQNIEPERKDFVAPQTPTNYTWIWIVLGILLFPISALAYLLYRHRVRKNEQWAEENEVKREIQLAKMGEERQADLRRIKERLKWLDSPEGIEYTKHQRLIESREAKKRSRTAKYKNADDTYMRPKLGTDYTVSPSPSYTPPVSPSYESNTSSYESSSSSSSDSGFSAGGDFSGGGSDGGW